MDAEEVVTGAAVTVLVSAAAAACLECDSTRRGVLVNISQPPALRLPYCGSVMTVWADVGGVSVAASEDDAAPALAGAPGRGLLGPALRRGGGGGGEPPSRRGLVARERGAAGVAAARAALAAELSNASISGGNRTGQDLPPANVWLLLAIALRVAEEETTGAPTRMPPPAAIAAGADAAPPALRDMRLAAAAAIAPVVAVVPAKAAAWHAATYGSVSRTHAASKPAAIRCCQCSCDSMNTASANRSSASMSTYAVRPA